MKKTPLISFAAWRFYLILAVISAAVLGLFWRVFDLSILDQQFLKKESRLRVLRLLKTQSFRGMITDRNDYPLAISTNVYSVWISPKEFKPDHDQLRKLSRLLKMDAKEIVTIKNRYDNTSREFVYLKRSLPPTTSKEIKMLLIPGLYLQEAYRRYYPEGEVTAHLIGFTNVDDQGQEGLELFYNDWLSGEAGKKWVVKDRLGRVITDVKEAQKQKNGRHLKLSIDRRIQYLAYREMMKAVLENQAESGSAVVLNVKTGEVLAMVNYPSFNPNKRPEILDKRYRNRAVTDSFEPGSTIKPFTVACALQSGHFKSDTEINTYPGWIVVDHHILKDEKNNGSLSVEQILQISSNVGVAKMVLSLPSDTLWNLLNQVGFGEITGVGFPGEQTGSLVSHARWGDFTLATLGIGYGLSVTTLQLARAYAVLGSKGVKLPLSLLALEAPPGGEQVMNPLVAKQMLILLESVVAKEGTGRLSSIPGYRVGGKTGTARIAAKGGYEKNHYVVSFVGIAPLTHPELVAAVVIRDPCGKNYYAAKVAAPVFKKIMGGTLRLLSVEPDMIQTRA